MKLIFCFTLFTIFLIPNIFSKNESVECLHPFTSRNTVIDDPLVPSEHNTKQDYMIIPIGCNCEVGLQEQKLHFRLLAFPFDWCICPYRALYGAVSSNFDDFFNKNNLVPSVKQNFSSYLNEFFQRLYYTNHSEKKNWVLDKKYEMIFNHEFVDSNIETINQKYEQQKAKYTRRINRFYVEIHSGKRIYFIRWLDITRTQAIDLCDLFSKKFPKTNFTLIVINRDTNEFGRPWNIPHIKNYPAPQEPNVSLFWKNLFVNIENNTL